MGLCGPVSGPDARRCAAAHLSIARNLQRGSLLGPLRRSLAPAPPDWPPWDVVYGPMRRWPAAGVFEQMTHDLRELLRLLDGRDAQPTAAILDSRTLPSTPESGAWAGFDGAKKKKGSKVHLAVDTLGH